jgi:hypothetical protein
VIGVFEPPDSPQSKLSVSTTGTSTGSAAAGVAAGVAVEVIVTVISNYWNILF